MDAFRKNTPVESRRAILLWNYDRELLPVGGGDYYFRYIFGNADSRVEQGLPNRIPHVKSSS